MTLDVLLYVVILLNLPDTYRVSKANASALCAETQSSFSSAVCSTKFAAAMRHGIVGGVVVIVRTGIR